MSVYSFISANAMISKKLEKATVQLVEQRAYVARLKVSDVTAAVLEPEKLVESQLEIRQVRHVSKRLL